MHRGTANWTKPPFISSLSLFFSFFFRTFLIWMRAVAGEKIGLYRTEQRVCEVTRGAAMSSCLQPRPNVTNSVWKQLDAYLEGKDGSGNLWSLKLAARSFVGDTLARMDEDGGLAGRTKSSLGLFDGRGTRRGAAAQLGTYLYIRSAIS